MTLHRNAAEWAAAVKPSEPHEPADAEQAVLDRAGFILDRRHRSRGVWLSLLDETSTQFKVFAVISVLAPILGMTAFWAGGLSGRHMTSYDFAASTENRIAVVAFSIAALCALVHLAGWLKLGRRTVDSDLVRAGAVALFSVIALGQIWFRPEQIEFGPATLAIIASLLTAGLGLALFLLAGSDEPFPEIDFAMLSDDDRDVLLTQRAAALAKLAERELIKTRQANKATERPLGALVGRRIG